MKLKYCVANIWINLVEKRVTFYAYLQGQYGLHLTEDINDPAVLWYDTKDEAKKHILNSTNECVIEKAFWNE